LVLARLIWRAENLSTFAVVKTAREPFIYAERSGGSYSETARDLEEIQAAQCAASVKAEEEGAAKNSESSIRWSHGGNSNHLVPGTRAELERAAQRNDRKMHETIDACEGPQIYLPDSKSFGSFESGVADVERLQAARFG
jgi:hypothetical protein